MIKALISKLYHKYVCKPDFDPHQTLEKFLELAEEEFELRKYYTVDTFEKLKFVQKLALINWRIKYYKE